MTDLRKFQAIVDLGAPETVQARAMILGFEAQVAKSDGAVFGDAFPLRHIFTPGIYAREITLPAGIVLVGKIHRERHLNFISRGHVKVFTESDGLEELRGPLLMVSEPGTKRTVHVLEETIWTTIHHNPDNLTDLKELEELVIAPSYGAFDGMITARAELEMIE